VTQGPCGVQVGFLLPHPCPNVAVGDCAKCGRAVCEEHATLADAGLLCRACETGSELPAALAGALAVAGLAALATPLFQPADLAAFEAAAPDETEKDTFADLS
jgi:hypothetical protein